MRRKLLVAVTALMLVARLGNSLSAAEPSAEELGVISDYLEANDVQGLRDYLALHPDLVQGNSRLANLLRRFLVESRAPNSFFRFDLNRSDSADGQQPSTDTDGPSGY